MSLNDTPSGNRIHIGIFGKRNAGKSSLMNALTGQEVSIVSHIKGTTTDPVKKSMEILPLGPVLLIDTPGLDDEGGLGELRVKRTKKILNEIRFAIVVIDIEDGSDQRERELIDMLSDKKIPYLIVYNKIDRIHPQEINQILSVEMDYLKDDSRSKEEIKERIVLANASLKIGIDQLKEKIIKLYQAEKKEDGYPIVSDLIKEGDYVVLVMPMDEAAPKGRIILPQQQTLRALLDVHAMVSCVQVDELEELLLLSRKKPDFVITDSQVFGTVKDMIPEDVRLTSFSILFARHKGELSDNLLAVNRIKELKEGDRILIAEGCTHHRQCDDIGTVKIPRWLDTYTGVKLSYDTVSGGEFPEDLSSYQLIVHCGGCTLTKKQMMNRMERAKEQGIYMCNYGILIAEMTGILNRCIDAIGYHK